MALNAHVKDRLVNWKFNQAKTLLKSGGMSEATTAEHDLVVALAQSFGDSGWFEGDMAIIVGAALTSIGL